MVFSTVKLYYLLPNYGGFGGPIRMLLDDAEVKYEYNLIDREQWPNVQAKWKEEGHVFDCVPMIELDGKRYSGTQPILRFLSKKLGKFSPADADLEQYVDVTADYAADWARAVFKGMFNPPNGIEEYKKNDLAKYFKRFDRIYGANKGPYAAGEEISYADFIVYTVMNLEANKDSIKDYPNLVAFAEAIKSRPGLQEAVKNI
ncbi:glutathione S-transferase [Lichtheimia hyalospora FSU 10163]|nr:glutathione S-transferase [Lichtheimia hyalospora FSU 10163]